LLRDRAQRVHLYDDCFDRADQLHERRAADVILRLMQGLLMQGLRQAPAVERQKNDVKHQYRQEVEQQRISDEGEVAANGNNPKVDHVLHAKGGQDQSRSQKSDFTGCHECILSGVSCTPAHTP